MDKKTKNGIIRNANFMPVTLLKTEVRISVEDKSLSSDQSLFYFILFAYSVVT